MKKMITALVLFSTVSVFAQRSNDLLDSAKSDIDYVLTLVKPGGTASRALKKAKMKIEQSMQNSSGHEDSYEDEVQFNYPRFNIGDKVYFGVTTVYGATIAAINLNNGKSTIKYQLNGSFGEKNNFVSEVSLDQLSSTTGCKKGICVGDLVYKGSSYVYGAKVLAIHKKNGTAVLEFKKDGSFGEKNTLVTEDKIIDLSVTSFSSIYAHDCKERRAH